jgi:hypothetical protein
MAIQSCSKFVFVERKYTSRILAGIHNLRVGKVPSAEVVIYVRSLEGSINYVNLMQPQKATKLRLQLQAAKCLSKRPNLSHAV